MVSPYHDIRMVGPDLSSTLCLNQATTARPREGRLGSERRLSAASDAAALAVRMAAEAATEPLRTIPLSTDPNFLKDTEVPISL